jgi:CHAD domain-containing protein
MTTELRETEQKYEAQPGVVLPQVAEVSGPQDETLTAEYFDTHDLRQAEARAPARPSGDKLTASSPAGDVVLAYVAAQAARLKALDPAVRRDEPDAIHQMRVTARRLRAAFAAFPMVVPGAATLHAQAELRWLGQVLGEARDNEVLSERFRAELASIPMDLAPAPVMARVMAHFRSRQATAQVSVRRALDSQRYLAIFDELNLLLLSPPVADPAAQPASEVLPGAIAQAYQRTRRRMRRAWRMQPGPDRDTALHEARKAAKRARYAAEAATPALGQRARRLARRMKAIQSTLGDHHDAVTAGITARQISVQAHLAREDTFSFGLLASRAHQQAGESQRRAKKAWKRAARRKATAVTRW